MKKVEKALHQISLTGDKKLQRGFTLVELMLVILILGMLSTVVALTLPPRKSDDINHQAADIQLYLRAVQQQALYEKKTYGVQFLADRLLISKLDENQWQSVSNQQPYSLSLKSTLDLNVEGDSITLIKDTDSNKPHIVFHLDGQFSPFKLTLANSANETVTLNGLFWQQ